MALRRAQARVAMWSAKSGFCWSTSSASSITLTRAVVSVAGAKHPVSDIPFDSEGYPDSSGVAIATVKIVQTGSRVRDSIMANKLAGYETTPVGYSWHHHQDTTTMQLVPTTLHYQTGHTGGYRGALRVVIFVNPGPELDSESEHLLEQTLGHALPGDYREFLRSYNGGQPVPCYVAVPGLPGGIADVQVLLGWGAEPQSSDIRWALSEVRERFPDDALLPIAWDSSGCQFVLRYEDGKVSAVEYVDLLASPVEFYHVAPSFTAFVEKLHPADW